MRRLTLKLTAEQRLSLEKVVRSDPKPYMRERAHALLKVSTGLEVGQVASMLPIPRQTRTVSNWIKRYKTEGLEGLHHRPGSGRRAAFFPSDVG